MSPKLNKNNCNKFTARCHKNKGNQTLRYVQ